MRTFYSDLLGLKEQFSGEEAISYDVQGTQIFFLKASHPLPLVEAWAAQPGYKVGNAPIPSFIVEVAHEDFDAIVKSLKDSRASFLHSEPTAFKGNRQFWVRDPMGNTVEIHDPGSREPASAR